MEKSKIIAIVGLVVLGGVLLVSRIPRNPQNEQTSATEMQAEQEPEDIPEQPETDATSEENADAADEAAAEEVTELIKEDLKVGDGAEAKAGDSVTVNYVGTLTDGTKFDSSYDRNQPFTFRLGAGEVIQGWDQGVEGMKVGGKRKLTIPSELGYGERGAGADIPPNATLIFEVELLSVD